MGALPETPPIRAVLEYARSLGIRIVRRADGESFDFGGMRVSVFAPPTEWQTSTQPRNNDSLVMRLQYKGSSVLLEGDAERVIEQRMMAEYGEVPDDDLTAHPAGDVGQQAAEKLVPAKFANTGREGRQDNLSGAWWSFAQCAPHFSKNPGAPGRGQGFTAGGSVEGGTSRQHDEFQLGVHPCSAAALAIISVGKGNRFGHPRPETLQRLEEAGAATYRTDLHGAVCFYLDGRTVTPQLACLR